MNRDRTLPPSLSRPRFSRTFKALTFPACLLLAAAPQASPAQQAKSPASAAPARGGISFAFVNAPVEDVVASVVGDGMGRPYRIAPGVRGRISLSSDRPLSVTEALARLDGALREIGARVAEDGATVQVVAFVPAPERTAAAPLPPPEPVEELVPVRNVDAASLLTVLQAMLPPDISATRVDGGIRLVGPSSGRRDAAELITLFDTRLAGQSFTMVQLEAGTPADIVSEMQSLFSQTRGVQLVPIERAGAILVIGEAGQAAQAVKTIQALDQGGSFGNRQLFIYPVSHGRASDLARVLGGLFGKELGREEESAADLRPGLVDPTARLGLGGSASATAGGITDRPARRAQREEMLAFGNEQVRIVADERSNSLAILASRGEWRLIQDFLRRLDVQPLQVVIEATIAEVTLNDRLEYGLQWFLRSGDFGASLSNATNGSVNPRPPGFSGVFDNLTDVRVVLDALKAVTNVRVISSPQLTVLNNQTATLQVGADVPVATQSATNIISSDATIVNSIEFRSTGVILRVTPHANASGMVTVDIEQEVSDVITTDTSDLNSPTIQQRRVESTVAVRSGETIALAGLIQDRDEQGRSGVPILSSIPVIGALFGTKTRIVGKTELLVLMTPRLIDGSQDLRAFTDTLRARFSNLPVTP